MNVLFVCSRNRLRSPTAEVIFADEAGIEVSSAGTSADAENHVSLDDVEWADLIFADGGDPSEEADGDVSGDLEDEEDRGLEDS